MALGSKDIAFAEAPVIKKKRPARFSVVKAVKQNARDRVGTPPPERVIEDARSRAVRKAARHKAPLGKLIGEDVE
jgi:hypothetical protein